MIIAIDCRSLRKGPSGIPNFLVTTINQIVKAYPDYKLYLLSNEQFHSEYKNQFVKEANIKIIINPLYILKQVSFLWLILKASFIVNKIKPDLYWSPAFLLPPFLSKKIKTLITVHDVVYKEHAATMSFFGKLYSWLLQDTSIIKADRLWANSKYTAMCIEKYYPNRKSKDIFTGFFVNTEIFKPIQMSESSINNLLNKYNINKSFFIFVGTLEPRKNLIFLLSLLPFLKHLNHKLLVVGAKGWGETNIKDIITQQDYPREDVVFSGFVETPDLVQLYNLASIYISTSINEGFGMPQLEAMACGCPVVSPHNSAMIEVVNGAGETVPTWEIIDWVNTIENVLANRNYYIQKGFARVSDYAAPRIVKGLLNYLNSI